MWAKPAVTSMSTMGSRYNTVEQIKDIKIVPLRLRGDADEDTASDATLEGDEEYEHPEKTPTPWTTRTPGPIWPAAIKDEIKEIQIVPVPKTMPIPEMRDAVRMQSEQVDDIKDVRIVPVPREVMPIPLNDGPPKPAPVPRLARVVVQPITQAKVEIKDVKIVPVPKYMSLPIEEADRIQLSKAEEIKNIKIVPVPRGVMPIPLNDGPPKPAVLPKPVTRSVSQVVPKPVNEEIKEVKIVPVPKFMPLPEEASSRIQLSKTEEIKEVKIVRIPRGFMPIPLDDGPPKPAATLRAPVRIVEKSISNAPMRPIIKDIKPVPVPRHMPILDGLPEDSLTWEEEQSSGPSHTPGPLELQLAALMQKIVAIERTKPTISVTPSDSSALPARIAVLEAEKRAWTKRHEALYALRDEDVANLIHVRGLLAAERKEHEALKKLRDDDLANLVNVRGKLAEATRKMDRRSSSAHPASYSPPSAAAHVDRPRSRAMERRSTTAVTLFEVAKTAALEQKVIELERYNQDLSSQVVSVKAQVEQAVNSVTEDMEAKLRRKEEELSRLRESAHNWAATHEDEVQSQVQTSSGVDWARFEQMHEDNLVYREKVGRTMATLRAQKEGLQRELNDREDEVTRLEDKVLRLEGRLAKA